MRLYYKESRSMKKLFNTLAAPVKKFFSPEKKSANNNTARTDAVMDALAQKNSAIEKYLYLANLKQRDTDLFFQTFHNNMEEVMPLVYTPTVGEACQKAGHIFSKVSGLHITPADKGKIKEKLAALPEKDIRAIVVTDGERILGLGDLGANGAEIPHGKLSLYSALGGIEPRQSLPVMFDVGTNNKALLADPLYLGHRSERLRGAEYLELMDEFIDAVKELYPKTVLQFEDFATDNAYRLLTRYQDQLPCFNDDIQGTGAVVLAGLYAAARETGTDFKDMRIMFLGAGSAATGIGDLIVKALQEEGLSEKEARTRLSFVDSKGLVTTSRDKLEAHKKPYAVDAAPADFLSSIDTVKPHVLIGATGKAGAFPKEAVGKMTALNERPVIFALSNPTANAECTAEDAYKWSKGKALFASGSPFKSVAYDGKTLIPGQANNAFVFPGIGLGAMVSKTSKITDSMLLAAARTLAANVSKDDLAAGSLYPRMAKAGEMSRAIAKSVIKTAVKEKLVPAAPPKNIDKFLDKKSYDPFRVAPQTGAARKLLQRFKR
ncbi:MAG: oxaloacetate-decarboxylating malate dehydrogenase [Proteobacteria bacterium]|nr:oxaloacetate-decarboxylating malate dehydrogenase [Pseudomonadota bacterium]